MNTKKSVQVRIPTELATDASTIASTMGLQISEYVEQVVRAAVDRDFPAAVKKLQGRLESKKNKGQAKE